MKTVRARIVLLFGLGSFVRALVAAPMPEIEMPSCVEGSPGLRMPADAARVALDGKDRAHFERAAQARYPLYQRGGLVPTEVVLIRRWERWQYVSLMHAGPGGRPCFSAVFAAERFDFTPGWLAKYKPRAAELAD